jgi:hypothetical protein
MCSIFTSVFAMRRVFNTFSQPVNSTVSLRLGSALDRVESIA